MINRFAFAATTAMLVSAVAAQAPVARISPANAAQLRQVAASDHAVRHIRRGPARGELTFLLPRGCIQIVDDVHLRPIRTLGKDQSRGYHESADKSLIATLHGEKNRLVRITHVKNGTTVPVDGGESPHRLVFSPDNKLLAVAETVSTDGGEGSGFTLVRLFDTETGQLVRELSHNDKGGAGLTPVFSPDGKLLAVGNRNFETRLYEVATGKLLHSLPKNMTQEIAFSPDGKVLATGYVDGTLGLWDVRKGTLLRSVESGCKEVYSVNWSPQGDLLVTSGRGGAIRVWDPSNLKMLKELKKLDVVISVRFTLDGARIVSAGRTREGYHLDTWALRPLKAPPEEEAKPDPTVLLPLEERPNILFAIADDWGYPHASIYGEPVVKTPTFDRIAREGVLFEHAFVSSPSCTPSRSAILAGRYHWELKGAANLWSVFPDEFPTFPEVLAEQADYFTGFEGKGWGPGKTETPGRQLTGQRFPNFQQFLKERPKGRPFCYWLGTSDPHRPFKAGAGKAAGMDLAKIRVPGFLPDSEIVRGDIADYFVEVQRFDALVGRALKSLEDRGELDNTIVVMTSDHGMPFPRAKSNLYDSGVRVPLAIRFGDQCPGGRTTLDFVSLVDLAPAFFELAGLSKHISKDACPEDNLVTLLRSEKSGYVIGSNRVVFGKERHVPSQEAPDMGGYPSRAIRTSRFLYIRNYRPDRWPNGTPHYRHAAIPGAWYADTDNGPTKTYMIENKGKDDTHRRLFDRAFAKRPKVELYNVVDDPDQLESVLHVGRYSAMKQTLPASLDFRLKKANDPRVTGAVVPFDDYQYLGGAPKFPGYKPDR